MNFLDKNNNFLIEKLIEEAYDIKNYKSDFDCKFCIYYNQIEERISKYDKSNVKSYFFKRKINNEDDYVRNSIFDLKDNFNKRKDADLIEYQFVKSSNTEKTSFFYNNFQKFVYFFQTSTNFVRTLVLKYFSINLNPKILVFLLFSLIIIDNVNFRLKLLIEYY